MILFCAYFAVWIRWVGVLQVGLKSIQENFHFSSFPFFYNIYFSIEKVERKKRKRKKKYDRLKWNVCAKRFVWFKCYSSSDDLVVFFSLHFFYFCLIAFNQAHILSCAHRHDNNKNIFISSYSIYFLCHFILYYFIYGMTKRADCHAKQTI